MKVSKAIRERRSVRRFDRTRKLTESQLTRLLEAARWAPSAGNLQSRYLILTKDPKVKKKLALAALGQIWVAQAPVVIILCADIQKAASRYGRRGRELYCLQDATLAGQNLWLAAVEMGLGAVWVGAFREGLVSRILNLPGHLRPVVLLPVGYPAGTPSSSRRLPLENTFEIFPPIPKSDRK